jgi:excisionase family DNA binding protein
MGEPDRLETRCGVTLAARYLGVSRRHIHHLITSGAIEAWDVRRPGARRATYAVCVSSIRIFLFGRYLPRRR